MLACLAKILKFSTEPDFSYFSCACAFERLSPVSDFVSGIVITYIT